MKKILSLALVLVMVLSVAALVGCSGDKEPAGNDAATLKFGLGVVSSYGEAKDADLGVAGAKDHCAIFVKGKIVKQVDKNDVQREFFGEIDKCLQ